MNIRTMRRLDRWVGIPLCLFLTFLRRLEDFFRFVARGFRPSTPACDSASPNILVVKLAEMGSTVLALPAIDKLKQHYPGARLHYLCFAGNEAVLKLCPQYQFTPHTIRNTSLFALLWDSMRVLWRLRRLGVDVAVDLEFFMRASAMLMYASGANIRVGYHRYRAEGLYCGDLYTHRLQFNSTLHTSEAFLTLAEATQCAGREDVLLKKVVSPPSRLPAFEPTEVERQAVLSKLQSNGYPAESRSPIVILNANASDIMPLRRWPKDRFLTMAREILAAHSDAWIVLTGAPSEAEGIQALHGEMSDSRVICLAGKTSLRELVTLFTLANVLVTNDSGPAHFAALSPIRIVSLFGPETPRLYHPLSPTNISLSRELACSPCINVFNQRDSACQDNQCMKQLDVACVYSEVEAALRGGDVSPKIVELSAQQGR